VSEEDRREVGRAEREFKEVEKKKRTMLGKMKAEIKDCYLMQ